MEISKSQPLLCDLVNVRGTNLATKTTHVGEAQVVSDDHHEVGAFRRHG